MSHPFNNPPFEHRDIIVPDYKLHIQSSSLYSFVLSPINKSLDTKREENDILYRMIECIL
jgi:hypothetical protein